MPTWNWILGLLPKVTHGLLSTKGTRQLLPLAGRSVFLLLCPSPPRCEFPLSQDGVHYLCACRASACCAGGFCLSHHLLPTRRLLQQSDKLLAQFCQESKRTWAACCIMYLYSMMMDNISDDIVLKIGFPLSSSFGKKCLPVCLSTEAQECKYRVSLKLLANN